MPTILILEDDLALASFWRRVFEEESYRVLCCETVSQSLRALSEVDVDVLVVDMLIRERGLPTSVGGITLAHKRAAGEIKRVPIIGVSGVRPHAQHNPIAPLEIVKTMGVERILYKPIAPETLLDTVKELASPV